MTVGLVLSYRHGTAAGATMAGVSVGGFFVVLIGQEVAAVVRRLPRRAPA